MTEIANEPMLDDMDISSALNEERRKTKRVPYEATVEITEFDGDKLPRKAAIQGGKASNLSLTGICFSTDEWPKNDTLVLSFHAGSLPARAVAQVVCVRRVQDDEGSQFQVHCEFIRWLTAPGEAPASS